MLEWIIISLIVLMIAGALVAVETSNLLYSVISVGAVGFLLSIVFLFLSAPDLAITQMAVEVITLVLLLRAVRRSELDTTSSSLRFSQANLVAIVLVLILAAASARMFSEFPPIGQPVMDRLDDVPSTTYLRDGLEKTGAANIVTAVLLDFRAYDTLGEATVLFCAVLGALTVLRPRAKRDSDATTDSENETREDPL